MPDRVSTQCDHCGQNDDHPKVHLGDITKHHDCLSVQEENALRDSGQEKDSGPKVSAIIDAAKGGTRGEKLLKLIESGKLPQAEGLHMQYSDPGKDN
jgi:hypothetical protein